MTSEAGNYKEFSLACIHLFYIIFFICCYHIEQLITLATASSLKKKTFFFTDFIQKYFASEESRYFNLSIY